MLMSVYMFVCGVYNICDIYLNKYTVYLSLV